MDPRFSKLLADMGEAALLEQCYKFMTFSTERPTEEQRQLLEGKFAQDRGYKGPREPVAVCGSYYDLENVVPPPKRLEKKEAESFWPPSRAKNFVRHLDAFNEMTWGQVSEARALEILAAAAKISVEKLLRTDPVTYSRMVHTIGEEGAKKLLGKEWFKN